MRSNLADIEMAHNCASEEVAPAASSFSVTTMPDIEKHQLYDKTLEQIRNELKDQKLFVSLSFCDYHQDNAAFSETLANLIVGPLKEAQVSGPKQCFLLKSVPTESYQLYTKSFLSKLFKEAMVCILVNKLYFLF